MASDCRASGERVADRLRPGRRALGPDVAGRAVAATRSAIAVDPRRRPTDAVGAGTPRAEIRTSTASAPGVGRHDRIGRPQDLLAEQVGDLRLADPGQAQRPARHRPRPTPRAASRGSASSGHIGRISRGGPGSATISPPSGRSTHQPGRRPVRVRQGRRRRDEPGLLEVHLRERHPAPRPRASRSQASRSGSTAGVSPTTAAIASRVRSSGVGPRPPVETTRSARPTARPRTRRATASRSSGSADDPADRDARSPVRLAGEVAGVRVAGLADRQLGADAQELGGQDAAGRAGHARSLAHGHRRAARPVRDDVARRQRPSTIGPRCHGTFARCRRAATAAEPPDNDAGVVRTRG